MKSISSQKLVLTILALFPAILPLTAQSLSPKQVKAALTSSAWKLETIWNPKNQEGNDSTRDWEVTTVEDSYNYKDHLGIIAFQFFPNGTFTGTHYKGRKVTEGKWSYSGRKKKGGSEVELRLEAMIFNEDLGGPLSYHIIFQKLEFKGDELIAEGDICHDGCYHKVKFKKVK